MYFEYNNHDFFHKMLMNCYAKHNSGKMIQKNALAGIKTHKNSFQTEILSVIDTPEKEVY